MYPRFIEVTTEKAKKKILVNIDSISLVTPLEDGCDYRRIYSIDGDYTDVTETYDELRTMIRESGCHIEKGDPRLDTTRPVSWDELTMMESIGQPLFNSNSRRWMLLIDSDSFRTSITLLNDQGGQEKWIEHDIVSKPLYRMRREK